MSKAIQFEHIGKQYRLGLVSSGTISHDLNRWWTMNVLHKEDPYLRIGETNDRAHRGKSDYVWALKDINFSVEEGDVVGIIGKNGAGKSTLLKLLSRVTAPTTGVIRARGRIASLLEVGTGFHPEMTGRENIYMNGAIMGMTKAEITRKLDEIVDFSGCERYIDTPVKRYSSGMTVRLGFAIAAHLEPEILVVDEVLAVGDAEFQKKAIGKMQDVSKGEGRTVLFVSHNMDAIRALCNNGIVLKNGEIYHIGSADDCVTCYLETNVTELVDYCLVTDKNRRFNRMREAEITSVRMKNDVRNVSCKEPLVLEIGVKKNAPQLKYIQIGVLISNNKDERVGSCYTEPISMSNADNYMFKVTIPHHNLSKGKYYLDFALSQFDYIASFRDLDGVYDTLSFEVRYVDSEKTIPFTTWPSPLGVSCYAFSKVEQII